MQASKSNENKHLKPNSGVETEPSSRSSGHVFDTRLGIGPVPGHSDLRCPSMPA